MRAGALVAVFALLTACSVFVRPTYDAGVIQALNDYHQNAVAFVGEMERKAGTPAGTVTSPQAAAFYDKYKGVLSNLVVRAQAAPEPQTCPTAKVVATVSLAMQDAVTRAPWASPAARETILGFDEQLKQAQADGTFDRDSCSAIVLKLVLANQLTLEALHRHEGRLAPPVSTQAIALIGDGVRIALRNEEAKKPIGAGL